MLDLAQAMSRRYWPYVKKREDNKTALQGVHSREVPAINAPWQVESEPLCERGSCGGERCQGCNGPFFCQKEMIVSADVYQDFIR